MGQVCTAQNLVRTRFRFEALLALVTTISLIGTLAAPLQDSEVKVSTLWSTTAVQPGERTTLAVVFEIPPGYHIGGNQTKLPLIPTTIQLLNGPDFVRTTTPIFPPADEVHLDFGTGTQRIKVYSGKVVAFVSGSAL